MDSISQTTFVNAISWMKILGIFIQISPSYVPRDPIDNESVFCWGLASYIFLLSRKPSQRL